MQGVEGLHAPLAYPTRWLVVGIGLVLTLLMWILVILFVTRNKKPKTVGSLAAKQGTQVDISSLRIKYLKLIDEANQAYTSGALTARGLHLRLSNIVRGFVYEASGFPAPRLTLSDLKKSTQHELTQLIAQLYPEEFAQITGKDVANALEAARKLVRTWA